MLSCVYDALRDLMHIQEKLCKPSFVFLLFASMANNGEQNQILLGSLHYHGRKQAKSQQ